ncbi:rnhA, partial [Mucuna pruriens]
MLAHTTWLIAKADPLNYIFKKPTLTGRITRWKMAMLEYDIVYKSQKAIKGSTLTEQLAHHPLGKYQPLLHEFLDEHIMSVDEIRLTIELDEWKLWFDGALNLLGFDCTNNMAEYKMLTAFGDSTLVIYQLCGEWETRDAKLIPYHNHIMEISKHFTNITFLYVPRDDNQMVDALATLSSILQVN